MRLKTILNKIEKFKSFVYKQARFGKDKYGNERIEVSVYPRKNSKAICSVCGNTGSTYDHLPERAFSYVPIWGLRMVLLYSMRRINCSKCGIKVEKVPWSEGKCGLTKTFSLFLARWSKKLSWKEVAETFKVNWEQVFSAVSYVVEYGLKHRNLNDVKAIGVDEIQYEKGHNYMTLVYQIDGEIKRLLYVGQDRKANTLLRFFHDQGKKWCSKIEVVCSDMWKPYRLVIKKKLKHAVHILDRFHIVGNLNKKLDEIRRAEAKKLKDNGYENVLQKLKYCFLKREENLTEGQQKKIAEVMQYDLKSVRAYLLKESFQLLWEYKSTYWARWFFKKWCTRAMRSKLEPIKSFVKSIRRHEPLIMNWFDTKKKHSSGTVEGLNRKINLITRKSYGFKSFEVMKIALFHTMGGLPEPVFTHKFL